MDNNNTKEIYLRVGSDNGNSEHDLVINGDLIQQPNVYAKVRKLPNLDEVDKEYILNNIEKNLVVTCENPNGIYYIGDYALKSGQSIRSIEVGVDNNKIDSPIVKVNILSQIAGYVVAKHGYKNNDIIKVKVDMATSLPVGHYDRKSATAFANTFLESTYLVTVHVGNKAVRVQIEFEFVKVIPEGVTTAFYLKDNQDDILNKVAQDIDIEDINSARILHVAIGEGTTEYPMTKGVEFNPNFIKGSNNGIGYAIDKAMDEFKGEVGLVKFSRQDYSNILKDKEHKFYDLALDIIEPYIEEQAGEILSHIKREIEKANNEIDIVLVYGGGSILMQEILENKLQVFCKRAKISLLYVPEEFSVTLEAKGLYCFVCNDIFKILKERYLESKDTRDGQ